MSPKKTKIKMSNMQTTEQYTSEKKYNIATTIVTGIICNKCNNELPAMTMKQHLDGDFNKECPHTDDDESDDDESDDGEIRCCRGEGCAECETDNENEPYLNDD